MLSRTPCFVRTLATGIFSSPYTYPRWYVDRNFPECGFLTRDEAHILLNAALSVAGKPALEIGSHVGWSTVHFALGGSVEFPRLTHRGYT